jgi:AraC-like DNA-binding protein
VSAQAGFHIAAFLTSAVSSSPDRTTQYRRGDIAFVDLSRPLRAGVTACTCLTATLSRSALSDVLSGAPSLLPIRIRREALSAKILRRTLASIVRSEGEFGAGQGAALGATLVSLIEDALYDGVDQWQGLDPQRVRERIDLARVIRDGLGDPKFSSSDILRLTGMTRAELRTLLAGRAMSDVLREYRIRAARNLLHSPAGRYLSIADVGRQVGFSSSAQFSTAYTAIIGSSPRADRKGDDNV